MSFSNALSGSSEKKEGSKMSFLAGKSSGIFFLAICSEN
jgi:hypothetical protein